MNAHALASAESLDAIAAAVAAGASAPAKALEETFARSFFARVPEDELQARPAVEWAAVSRAFLAFAAQREAGKVKIWVGNPTLASDPRFDANARRNQNRQALRTLILEAFASLNGPAFYGLAPNADSIMLRREAWSVTPNAWGDSQLRYRVSHAPGLSLISHRRGELEVTACWCVDPQTSVKQISLRLHGPLNLQALQGSFDALLARHESLRTTFTHDSRDGGPRQQIAPQLTVAIECRERGVGDEQAQIQAFVEAHREQPFDLQHGPVLRVALLRLAAEDHVLSLVVHHIAADGWSLKAMVDELLQGYSACCQGHAVAVRPLPIQYADYAIWQRRWMEAGERERQLAYWQAQLGGQQPVLERLARGACLTAHAAHLVQPPMQVDHRLAARPLMQAVDILGEQQLDLATGFQRGPTRNIASVNTLNSRYFSLVQLRLTTKTQWIFLLGDCSIPSVITWHLIFTMNT